MGFARDRSWQAARDGFGRLLESPMPMDEETRELQPRVLGLAPDARTLLAGFADAIRLERWEVGQSD